MAVAYELRFRGATLEQYDRVLELMGFAHRGAGAPGGLFHWVRATDDGIVVTDVWETPEHFKRFADEQIGPYTRQAGFAGEPEIRSYEVYNYLTAG